MIVRFTVNENESLAMFLEDYGLKLVSGCDSYWVEGDYVAGYDEYEVEVPQLSDVQISAYWAGSIINYLPKPQRDVVMAMNGMIM